jgi:hypothetical protein
MLRKKAESSTSSIRSCPGSRQEVADVDHLGDAAVEKPGAFGARDRNNPISANQIRLQTSLIN